MSFDDGYHPDMTSEDDFRPKFCALMQQYRTTFAAMCEAASVDPGQAERAIVQGSYGLPTNAHILQSMLSVFGLSLDWLLVGTAQPAFSQHARRLELLELVYQFSMRAKIPKPHRTVLIKYEMAKIDSEESNSLRLAAHPGVPRTMREVGYDYAKLLKEGMMPNEPAGE